jgi:hypothetical protein
VRPKGVTDGKQVNIPAPVCARYELWGDAEVNPHPVMDVRVQGCTEVG